MVYLTLRLLVLKGKVLDLAHDSLILSEVLPVQVVVVNFEIIARRLIFYLFEVVLIVSIAGVF